MSDGSGAGVWDPVRRHAAAHSTIARLPQQVSARLPSRGQVAVQATINGHTFETVLEPDGQKGHWLCVDEDLRQAAAVDAGDRVDVGLEVTREWPEPQMPADLVTALAVAPGPIRDMWQDLTPMARSGMGAWINATDRTQSHPSKASEVSISKMMAAKRRPCCFDLSSCTDPAVSKGGKLRSAT